MDNEKMDPKEISEKNLIIAKDLLRIYQKHKEKDPVLASDAKEAHEFYLAQSKEK